MDFTDRLRTHLQTQSDELRVSPEGSDAVRTRSRKRKQRRAGGTVLATVLVAVLAGGWLIGRSGDTEANLATEGGPDAAADGSLDATGSGSDSGAIDAVLPDPGAALVLTEGNNENAPGGYNVYQSGRSGDLYYVLSTAPGLTYDDIGEGVALRNDTVYTFDGSTWSQSSTADRFVSTFDAIASGLLYTVSTGTPGGPALELGTSSNAGADWSWTELDLSSVFGADRSAWPAYSVQHATNGTTTLVIVHSPGQIDFVDASELAAANGAAIDPESAHVVGVDDVGITWIDDTRASSPCLAALDDALTAAWENEPEGPEFDVDRELTAAEQAELEAYWDEQDRRAATIYAEALQSVGRVPGCESFVKCTNEHAALRDEFDKELAAIHDGTEGDELTEEEYVELDAHYMAFTDEVAAWAKASGCDEVTPFLLEGDEMEGDTNYAAWSDLGVATPDGWASTTTGFLVDGSEVTDLGEVFGAQSGYLVYVGATAGGWSVTFDETTYEPDTPSAGSYTTWGSIDGATWTSTSADSFNYAQPATLANGTSFTPDWSGESTGLIRMTSDGTTNALSLSDLALGIDISGYQIMNVRAGSYGVVAWAVRWEEAVAGDPPYDSIVLYSPDGAGWGATEVPDVEVVEVIVGEEEVVLFLNDPLRPEGAAQPIMIGQA